MGTLWTDGETDRKTSASSGEASSANHTSDVEMVGVNYPPIPPNQLKTPKLLFTQELIAMAAVANHVS